MAKRRSRSLSLFQPTFNSTTARLEGLYENDDAADLVCNPSILHLQENQDINGEDVFSNSLTILNQRKADLKFVQLLRSLTNVNNGDSYKKTLNKIDFNQVVDFNMSNDELRAKFDTLVKSIGKFRTFYSAVHDTEMYLHQSLKKMRHPEKPSMPMSARMLHMKELMAKGKRAPAHQKTLAWASEKYNELSVRDKSRYIKTHEKLMEKYSRQLEEFYNKYPNERPQKKQSLKIITPFNLFFDELINSSENNVKRVEAIEQWNILPVKKKVKFIKRAYQFRDADTVNTKVTISNREKNLLEEHNGKPEKPPMNIYLLYKQENSDVPEILQQYKLITKEGKKQLKERLTEMVHQYVIDMKKYLKKLPEDAKTVEQEELSKLMSRFKLTQTASPRSSRKESKKRSRSAPEDMNCTGEESTPRKKLRNSSIKSTGSKNAELAMVTIHSDQPGPPEIKNEFNVYEEDQLKENLSAEREKKTVKQEKIKESKKPIKKDQEFIEIQPPRSLFKYYVSINSFDSLKKAKKIFLSLPKLEKKNLKNSYNMICESYITNLRGYIKSLGEHEAKKFIKQYEKKKAEEEDTDDDLTSNEESTSSDDSDD